MAKIIGVVVATANNYATVKIEQTFFQAHIRGALMSSQQILVGDNVLVSKVGSDEIVIEEVLPRKNQLYRPKIANVDQVLIVNAMSTPTFNTLILNKLLTLFNFYQLKVILVFTKVDLVDEKDLVWNKIKYYQELKYPCYFISNTDENHTGVKELSLVFEDKLSILTGVTGVGKSSLLNSLQPSLNLTTNEISLVLKHGKHTTTTTKLYFLMNGIIADSPGFMVLKLQGLSENDLASNFPCVKEFFSKCKFRNCLHQQEPECAVIANLKNSELNQFFYQDYCKILLEFIHLKPNERRE